jgi:hypothetical protein
MYPFEYKPDKHERVLLFGCYKSKKGRKTVTIAEYIYRFCYPCTCTQDCDCEYSEPHDEIFIREGWYEVVEYTDEFMYIPILPLNNHDFLGWERIKWPEDIVK